MSSLNKDAVLAAAAEQLADFSYLEKRNVLHEYSDSSLFPSTRELKELVEQCRAIFFPGFYGQHFDKCSEVSAAMVEGVKRIHELLTSQIAAGLYMDERTKVGRKCKDTICLDADRIATQVVERLPEIKHLLETDVEAAYRGDPAAVTYSEVVGCYPAIRALSIYRLAHVMHELGVPLIPRMLTEMAHSETGIDIHPGAQIGSHFTIDHGTGVVIGATTIIGNNVKLYQGVTLGAKSFPLGKDGAPIKGILRHPILKDNVIVYSNATILGRVTVGEGAVIGGNMWITDDVPAGAKLALQCR